MFDTIKSDIEALKKEVYGPKKESKRRSYHDLLMVSMWDFYKPTLREEVEGLNDRLDKANKLISLLLDHHKLEYVKLTEENGSKKIVKTLRKVKAKRGRKPKNKSYDYNDEN